MVQNSRPRCELAYVVPEQEEREAGMLLRDASELHLRWRSCQSLIAAKLREPALHH